MRINRLRSVTQSHAGFSLIEVLVAVLLLSIGLLGLATLQTTSLQRENSSAQRVEALNHAYDLLDRMRANRAQAIAGNYNVLVGESPSGSSWAETDVRTWKQALAAALPGGDAAVDVEDQIVDIRIVWSDASKANAGGSTAASVNLRTQL